MRTVTYKMPETWDEWAEDARTNQGHEYAGRRQAFNELVLGVIKARMAKEPMWKWMAIAGDYRNLSQYLIDNGDAPWDDSCPLDQEDYRGVADCFNEMIVRLQDNGHDFP